MAMTTEQFEHWKDFALRMARACFKRRRSPTAAEIESNIASYFEWLDPEYLSSIVSWDHSDRYPESSKYYRRTYKTCCWHCHGSKKPDCPYACEDGQIYNYAHAPYVCDSVSELGESWNPYYWHRISEREYEKRDEQFCGPVRCCIRAGLDLAASPSMGVMGFTAGDLRRMYPEGVPDWVTGGKDHRWQTQEFVGVVPGVGLIPGELKENGTFAEMSDDAPVWL